MKKIFIVEDRGVRFSATMESIRDTYHSTLPDSQGFEGDDNGYWMNIASEAVVQAMFPLDYVLREKHEELLYEQAKTIRAEYEKKDQDNAEAS